MFIAQSKEAVKSAKAFIDAKEFERAKHACENALILDANNINLLLLHGKACVSMNKVHALRFGWTSLDSVHGLRDLLRVVRSDNCGLLPRYVLPAHSVTTRRRAS